MLMFEKHTFTVELFKEYLLSSPNYSKLQNSAHFFGWLHSQFSIENKVSLKINQSSVNTVSEEIDCQLLKLGAASWKTGKLRFKAIANYNDLSEPQLTIEIELEFCPDQPELLETSDPSLDELRKQLQIDK
jgi:hypothetical protein